MKTDISPYNKGLATLRELDTVRFRYNETLSGEPDLRVRYGLVAQEAERVDPNLVTTFKLPKNGDEYLSIDTSSLIYVLADAVKSLDKTVADLEERESELLLENVTLRLMLIDLYKRVEALESAKE